MIFPPKVVVKVLSHLTTVYLLNSTSKGQLDLKIRTAVQICAELLTRKNRFELAPAMSNNLRSRLTFYYLKLFYSVISLFIFVYTRARTKGKKLVCNIFSRYAVLTGRNCYIRYVFFHYIKINTAMTHLVIMNNISVKSNHLNYQFASLIQYPSVYAL